jgi:hypothetical protein
MIPVGPLSGEGVTLHFSGIVAVSTLLVPFRVHEPKATGPGEMIENGVTMVTGVVVMAVALPLRLTVWPVKTRAVLVPTVSVTVTLAV